MTPQELEEQRRRAGGLASIPASARTAPITQSNRAVSQQGPLAAIGPNKRNLEGIRRDLQAKYGQQSTPGTLANPGGADTSSAFSRDVKRVQDGSIGSLAKPGVLMNTANAAPMQPKDNPAVALASIGRPAATATPSEVRAQAPGADGDLASMPRTSSSILDKAIEPPAPTLADAGAQDLAGIGIQRTVDPQNGTTLYDVGPQGSATFQGIARGDGSGSTFSGAGTNAQAAAQLADYKARGLNSFGNDLSVANEINAQAEKMRTERLERNEQRRATRQAAKLDAQRDLAFDKAQRAGVDIPRGNVPSEQHTDKPQSNPARSGYLSAVTGADSRFWSYAGRRSCNC